MGIELRMGFVITCINCNQDIEVRMILFEGLDSRMAFNGSVKCNCGCEYDEIQVMKMRTEVVRPSLEYTCESCDEENYFEIPVLHYAYVAPVFVCCGICKNTMNVIND